MKDIKEKILIFLKNNIEDILIFSGLTVVVITTFFISKIIAFYMIGIFILSIGIYLSLSPPNKTRGR